MCKLWGNSYVSSQGIFALPHNVSWVVNSDLAFLPFNRSLQLYSSNINWNIFSECILEFCKCRNILNSLCYKKKLPRKKIQFVKQVYYIQLINYHPANKNMLYMCCYNDMKMLFLSVFWMFKSPFFKCFFLICEHLKG